VGLGLPLWVLTWTLTLLAAAALITVGQRTWAVVKANRVDHTLADDTATTAGR
jgi:CDP-diacylglycerol--glycerol-3-phosphate 3-phosphatidyltransferase